MGEYLPQGRYLHYAVLRKKCGQGLSTNTSFGVSDSCSKQGPFLNPVKKIPVGRWQTSPGLRMPGSNSLCQGRPLNQDSLRKPWIKALSEIGMDPRPVIHDLRHTFVANCRRSGVSHEIVQVIVGHWNRAKKVSERYGRFSNQELVEAIDQVS